MAYNAKFCFSHQHFCSRICRDAFHLLCRKSISKGRVTIAILAIVILLLLSVKAFAAPWDNAPDELKRWFSEQEDENGKLCCDTSDALPVTVEKQSGNYQFLFAGEWWTIPPEKIRFVEMPPQLEGKQIVFANLVNGEMFIHCVRLPIPKI